MKKIIRLQPEFRLHSGLHKTPDFSFITPGDIFTPVPLPCHPHIPFALFLPSSHAHSTSLGARPLSSLASISRDINTASDSTAVVQPSC